ncbi:MAG: hypothetical protein H7Y88_12345 [Phycisphaerales bacterium]|nr:hypothetical protein [Phycisphaerales bacterium]
MKNLLGTVAAVGVLAVAGSALAGPIAIGGAAFKNHPTVTDLPSYTQAIPAYFIPVNVVATLNSPIVGGLAGSVVTTVYLNPNTNTLTFDYVFSAAASNPVSIVRATLGGPWLPILVNDAGAGSNGISGGGDGGAEWNDGDPFFLARSPEDGSPNVQWRAFGLGSALGAGNVSSNIWFETNATLITEAPMAVIDTAVTGSGLILAPVIPAPGAAALALMGVGIAARRRRA